MTNIGVICHEFGHILGSPDFYDTNYEIVGSYDGTGQWDLMASGSWNGNGAIPPHQNGYIKTMIYNWAPLVTLEEPDKIILENAAFNNKMILKESKKNFQRNITFYLQNANDSHF